MSRLNPTMDDQDDNPSIYYYVEFRSKKTCVGSSIECNIKRDTRKGSGLFLGLLPVSLEVLFSP